MEQNYDELNLVLTMNYLNINHFTNSDNISLEDYLIRNLVLSKTYKSLNHEYKFAILIFANSYDITDFDNIDERFDNIDGYCENLKNYLISNNLNFTDVNSINAIECI